MTEMLDHSRVSPGYLAEEMRSINHLLSEIDAAYHEASLRLGLADSAMQILYILCSQGGACLLRNICRQSGTSKQTINSALLGIVLIRPIAAWLGAEGEMLDQCVLYGRIILPALPAYMLQYEFQSFFATAEKPQLGLGFTIAAGLTNMVLDAFFCCPAGLGPGGRGSGHGHRRLSLWRPEPSRAAKSAAKEPGDHRPPLPFDVCLCGGTGGTAGPALCGL